MKRLIADASKMAKEQENLGIKVDPTSMGFDNVINAVAVMQEHLGIAGATAAEAAGTIEGSFKMMAASGKNLISALANPDADIGGLVGTFVDSTMTFASNILPAIDNLITGIGQAFPAIGQAFAAHAPELAAQGSQIISHIYNGIMTAIPQIAAAAPQAISNFANGFSAAAPGLIMKGAELIAALVNGLATAIPSIVAAVPQILSALVSGLSQAAPTLLTAGINLIAALVNGILSGASSIAGAALSIIGSLLGAIAGAVGSLVSGGLTLAKAILTGVISGIAGFIVAGVNIVRNVISGIQSSVGTLISSGVKIVKNVINGAKGAVSGAISIGKNIVHGVWQGISGAAGWLGGKVTGFFKRIVNTGKSVLGIHSPSKVFQNEIGVFIALGVAEGIKKGTPQAVKAAEELAKAVYEKSKAWIDKNKEEMELSLAEQLEVWTTIQGQFVEGSKQYADAEKEIQSIRKDIREENKKLQEDYNRELESRSQKIFDSYKLFDKVPEMQKVSGEELLSNLKDQLAAVEAFYNNLEKLGERTGNAGLVEYIKNMGVGAAAELDGLLNLSNEKLDEFSALFDAKKAQADELAAVDLSGMKKEVDTQIKTNNEALKGIFKTDAPPLGEQFSNGIAEGIKAGASGVINAAVGVANAAVEATKTTLDIHSPSRVMKKIGNFMSEGLSIGFVDKMKDVTSQISDSIRTMTGTLSNIPSLAGAGGGSNNTYGGIYLTIEHMDGGKESVETLAEELEFLRKRRDEGKGDK